MVHVHAEVCQALLNRPSLRIDYANFILPALAAPMDESSWTNRILWLSARVLQWAETGIQTSYEWQYLSNMVDEWELRRPASFDPFFHRKEDLYGVNYFPEFWFSAPCHGELTSWLVDDVNH